MMFQVTIPQSDRHDTGVMYKKLTVKELNEVAPGVRHVRFRLLRFYLGFDVCKCFVHDSASLYTARHNYRTP